MTPTTLAEMPLWVAGEVLAAFCPAMLGKFDVWKIIKHVGEVRGLEDRHPMDAVFLDADHSSTSTYPGLVLLTGHE